MKQSGYLFTAGVNLSQMVPSQTLRGDKTLQSWDTCMSVIVYGDDPDRAQETFEDWCHAPREGEPVQTQIQKIVGVQLIDQLLAETGSQPLDLSAIRQTFLESALPFETEAAQENTSADLEGFWVDVHQTVPPQSSRLDLDSLKRGLPEDISSALNWSADKKFLFLVTTLAPRPIVTAPIDEIEEDPNVSMERDDDATPVLDETVAQLPEMREKEAAALVEARNSVVAAWLWRKFAATMPLASNEILVTPCCPLIPEN